MSTNHYANAFAQQIGYGTNSPLGGMQGSLADYQQAQNTLNKRPEFDALQERIFGLCEQLANLETRARGVVDRLIGADPTNAGAAQQIPTGPMVQVLAGAVSEAQRLANAVLTQIARLETL